MKLVSSASRRWGGVQTPEMRRGTIRPRSATKSVPPRTSPSSRRKVHLEEPINKVPARLHRDVTVEITVNVLARDLKETNRSVSVLSRYRECTRK